ncbi:hypothetical protein GOP47_0018540 [Adiantum capillus-veneris]|uniref:AAA+ ATPase domain-containing protein n=1 Tax=Adiantum capillus-veneris TaxID=13818 RepID=A0A9D4UDE7_ADICA|nr:hypothetical protein GOP47_0018540 [Adiantum capillus-veneris]
MYKSAARANPALLRRSNKHAPCAYKHVVPKPIPLSGKFNNAAYHILGLKGPSFSPGHSIKRAPPVDTASSIVQWQKKWLVRPSLSIKEGINNAAATRSARMFSGKSKGKENIEKQDTNSLNPSKKQNGKEAGRTSKKPSNKRISEGHSSIKNTESSEANSAQRQEPLNVKSTVSDKRKRESSQSTISKCKVKQAEKKKVSIDTTTTKNVQDFERLQLLKGKLIRKLRRNWICWENIRDTLDDFPYYLHKNTRDLLLDCVAVRVKKHKFSRFGENLPNTSHLILLQGQPGTELYQEALVRAMARILRVSLLVADSSTLSAKDLKDDRHIAGLPPGENNLDNDEKALHIDRKVNRETVNLANLERVNQMLGCQVKILDLKSQKKKFDIPLKVLRFSTKEDRKEMSELVQVDNQNWENELKDLLVTGREEQLKKLGKKGEEFYKYWHDLIIGDHVRYKGSKALKAKSREKVRIGQEGFVSSISESLPWKVCVKFHGVAEDVFCDAAELEKVNSNGSDEAWLARFPELPIEALCKMVPYCGPVIVHFPDIQQWFSSVHPNGETLKDLLTKVDGPVVFIASSFKKETSVPMAAGTSMESMLGSFIFETQAEPSPPSKDDNILNEIFKIFKNVVKVLPPEEPHLLRVWQKELEENKKKATWIRNLMLLEESLEKNCMECAEILDINPFDMQLTSESADDVIGWARNMIYYSNQVQISEGRLLVEKSWLERSLVRLKDLKFANEEKISHVAGLVENVHEKSLASSVILAQEIGVKFDEVGALENVKSTLNELIVLPLKRPELFRKGNLRKTCKGVLLFGPPGTGKTLIAKAVATEAGANFINVSAASITSKWYGEDEKLVWALFALAKKLSPAVIFVDEVDSLLGSRNDTTEGEASRRIKTEFMAAWDGLQSNESEQILIFAATNRPFDLDDAVIRRLPRRILVDLPNAENRAKILRIILASEDLDSTFSYESLALQTEGYSGSDLKNLCVTAAYVPIRELLEAEQQESEVSLSGCHRAESIRPLCMNDFLQAKAKIGASVAYDAAAMIQIRQWNEQYGEGGSRWQKRIGFSHTDHAVLAKFSFPAVDLSLRMLFKVSSSLDFPFRERTDFSHTLNTGYKRRTHFPVRGDTMGVREAMRWRQPSSKPFSEERDP